MTYPLRITISPNVNIEVQIDDYIVDIVRAAGWYGANPNSDGKTFQICYYRTDTPLFTIGSCFEPGEEDENAFEEAQELTEGYIKGELNTNFDEDLEGFLEVAVDACQANFENGKPEAATVAFNSLEKILTHTLEYLNVCRKEVNEGKV